MNRHPLVVLVAEPDRLTCDTIVQMLEAKGHAVTFLSNLHSGSKVLDTFTFNAMVISLDAHYSKIDQSLIEVVKAKQPYIKVIGFSGNIDEPTEKSTALIDAFLRKPFTLAQLDERLNRVVRSRTVA